jgi:hypothetical protein
MNKERFTFVCNEAEGGRDAFVLNSTIGEEGRVESCAMEHLVVETNSGGKRCWDYREVEEMSRSTSEFPYR